MKAAVFHGPRDIRVDEVDKPVIGNDEVLVEPRIVGICGSDINRYRRGTNLNYLVVAGHECCGQVAQVGSAVENLRVGERVVIHPNFGCGKCLRCRTGRENLCPHRIKLGVVVDGCLAEYVKAPANYVYPIPERLSDEVGALVEPAAVAIRALGKIVNPFEKRVLIFGAGAIGLFALQVAKRMGATVFITDLLENRLSLAKEFGADGVINARTQDPVETAKRLAGKQGVDAILETAGGTTKPFELAMEVVKPGGRVILVGYSPDAAAVHTDVISRNEIEIIGSTIYCHEEFSRAIELLSEGKINGHSLITHTFFLQDIGKALDIAEKGEGIKVMINIGKT
jgi:L-iditol 2-dehydrogenase